MTIAKLYKVRWDVKLFERLIISIACVVLNVFIVLALTTLLLLAKLHFNLN